MHRQGLTNEEQDFILHDSTFNLTETTHLAVGVGPEILSLAGLTYFSASWIFGNAH